MPNLSAMDILKWAEVGAQLINVLGVPTASVIRLFRESGGTDAEADALLAHWQALDASVEARIAFLRSKA